MPARIMLTRLLTPEQLKEVDAQLADQRRTYREVVEWMASRGWQVNEAQVRAYAHHFKLREPRRPRRSRKIDSMLTPNDRSAYDVLLTDRRTTVEVAHAWLKQRGYDVSKPTVYWDQRTFRATLDRVRENALVAEATFQLCKDKGPTVMADGVALGWEQVMFEQLNRIQRDEKLDAGTMVDMSRSVATTMTARGTLEGIRGEFEKVKHAAVEAARKDADGGTSGKDVVARMREILGV